MQTCVVSSDRVTFQERCGELLQEGWEVIPGTVVVSTSVGDRGVTEKVMIAFFTDGQKEEGVTD